jgi:transcriptional regulator with XRE-family HTH domain
MRTLQELVQDHIGRTGTSARTLAEAAGMSYPTLLAVVNKGSLPRKAEHREALRQILGLQQQEWSIVILRSAGYEIAEKDVDPPTFQVLVASAMLEKGFNEQTLSKTSKVPFPTVVNIVREGVVPKPDAIEALRHALGLDAAAVEHAVGRTRSQSIKVAERTRQAVAANESLSQLLADRIRDAGQTIAQYARDHELGYLTLSRYLSSGQPPTDAAVRERLCMALGLTPAAFAAALARDAAKPQGVTVGGRAGDPPPDATSLQVALLRYLREHNLTIKSLSQKSGLSQITVSRLVKQGAPPSRARTHQQLQELLGLSETEYQQLIQPRDGEAPPSAAAEDEDETEGATPLDDFEPSDLAQSPAVDSPGDTTLRQRLSQLKPNQRDELLKMIEKMK